MSPERWDNFAPTNKHQLAAAFGALRPTYYVDVPGHAPTAEGRRSRQTAPSSVRVVSLPGLPQRFQKRSGLATAVQAFVSVAAAALWLRRDGVSGKPDVLVYFPYPLLALRLLRPRAVIYHCVDHHASFPDLRRQRQLIDQREAALLSRADVVVASSPALLEHCREVRPEALFLPNVADVELFASVRWKEREGHDLPVLFFHGTFSEHKIDFALLERLAASGDVELRLAGVLPDAHAAGFMSAIEASGHVTYLGAMRQHDIVTEIARADVLLLPYVLGEHTRYVLPLKLVEYLATGLPVISTRLPSVVESAPELVTFLDEGDDPLARVGRAAAVNRDLAAAKRTFVSSRSWNTRVAEFESLLSQTTESKAAA